MSYRDIPSAGDALKQFLRKIRDDVDRIENGGAIKGNISLASEIRIGDVIVTVSGDDGSDARALTFTNALTGTDVDPNTAASSARLLTTTAGLGRGSAGEQVTFVAADGTVQVLSWNSAAGMWVGKELPSIASGSDITTAGTTYAVDRQGPLNVFGAWLTVGLTMQVRIISTVTAGAASSGFVACATIGADAGGAQNVDTTNVSAEVTTSATSPTTLDSGWVSLNSGVTPRAYLALALASKRSGANNATITTSESLVYRWTYTPPPS